MLSTSLPRRTTLLSVAGSDSPAQTGDPRQQGRGESARPRALLVDDSLTLQFTLKDALVAAGFTVVVCTSGGEARRALRQGAYSVIILDVMLPDTNGVALAQEVKSAPATSHLPVILLSANAGIEQRVSGVAGGADDFIGKACGPAYVVKRARELSLDPVKEQRPESDGPHRVLLIDDSPTFVDALASRMRLSGHDIIVASSGMAALDYLNVQAVDVIVLDLVMPELSGIDMCRRIKGTPALTDVPIVVISGREDGTSLMAGSLAGIDDYIRKSEGLQAILSRLDKLLRRRPAPPSRPSTRGESTRGESAWRTASSEVRSEALPVRGRISEPPQSLTRRISPSDPGEAPSNRGGPVSPLFEKVASVCGLSTFIARSSLKRALVRAGLNEATFASEDVARAMPEIRWALSVFLPPTEIDARMELIEGLAKEGSIPPPGGARET